MFMMRDSTLILERKSDLNLITHSESATDATVYTFTVPFGNPDPNRLLIAHIVGRASLTPTLSSVTIGGVSATVHVNSRNTASSHLSVAIIASAIVPTGVSGDIVVTFSPDVLSRCAVALYRATKYSSATPTKTATTTRGASAGSMIMTLSAPDKGFQTGVITSFGGTNHRIGTASAFGSVSVIEGVSQTDSNRWKGLNKDTDYTMEASSVTDQAAGCAGWKYP